MKIKITELWRYTGVTIYIEKDMTNDYLKKGVYIFVEKEIDSLRLYNVENGFCFIEEYDEDDEIQINDYSLSTKKRGANLVEAHTAMCLDLINDGWTEDAKSFNLTPHLEKLKAYKSLMGLTDG